jgi:hypothetical protein
MLLVEQIEGIVGELIIIQFAYRSAFYLFFDGLYGPV